MNEREVLELMRALFVTEDGWRNLKGLAVSIDRRLAALPAAAQEKPDPTRCVVCGWTLAGSREQGCVAGDCSYRPAQGTPEHDRIKDRLRAQMSAPAAAQADGEEPTLEECVLRYSRHPGNCREAIADLRAFILASRARPAPSQAVDVEGIVSWLKERSATPGADIDDVERVIRWKLAQFVNSSPAPSHALVEAADAMRGVFFDDVDGAICTEGTTEYLRKILDAYDLARATLAAAKKDGGA